MKLLGPYNSKLQSFHYQELLDLDKEAIASGEFMGNKTFDEAAINTLVQQSRDFASLPQASEGQRVTDDSINRPLDLLQTRFNSLVSEANDFTSRTSGLLDVLKKDTVLLDQLLIEAELNKWLDERPDLDNCVDFSWDYGVGNGPTSTQVEPIDPVNGVAYPSECPTNTYLDVIDSTRFTGLVAPSKDTVITAKNLLWQWTKMTTGEQSEDLYGDGWAELNLLEDRPLLNFLPNPAVQTILPTGGSTVGVFNISGAVAGGSLPIFVRTIFHPRRNQVSIPPQNALVDPGFEAVSSSWTLEAPWTIQSGGNAHSGSKYVSKGFFAAWSSLTTYAIGNTVLYQNVEYKSLTNGNLNNIPNQPSSTSWVKTGKLLSASFPLQPRWRIYIEGWVKSLSANGILDISLSCRDENDNEISPQVAIPGITSATDWLQVSDVVEVHDDANVVAGRLVITVHGQSAGAWLLDDFRIHLPQNLSAFTVNQDDVAVFLPKFGTDIPLTVYFDNEEFIVDDVSNVTFMNLPDGTDLTVRFTESFPGYQCSVNEKVWSPLVMLDPSRPYPDEEQNFDPIQILVDPSDDTRSLFPITDELGIPTGLTLRVASRPLFEYYIQITTPAAPQYGATAILEIDLSRPAYLNGLTLAPFATYPIRLTRVETESFTADTRQTVGAPNILIDRPMVLTFPTTLVRKVYLTCYQENYNLTEHVVDPPDALRRDTLFALQTVLPFNVRRPSRAVPVYFRGAQYTFGLENISGILAAPVLPGIFIAGPHHFKGCPDIFRFDASIFTDFDSVAPEVQFYLCWKAFNAAGQVLHQELDGIAITSGQCSVWPFPNPSVLDRTQVDHTDVFLKFVLRNEENVIERYLLQITKV
jgi:hypothetical protein